MGQVRCVDCPCWFATIETQAILPAVTRAVLTEAKQGADVVTADHLCEAWVCGIPHFDHWFFVVGQTVVPAVCITCVDDGEPEHSAVMVLRVAEVEGVTNLGDVVDGVHVGFFL